jgi:DNA-binding beta-propeller fold protein YncE
LGNIVNAAGERELRVFVVCFDSRKIYIYDPDLDRIEIELTTGRGPHALSIDNERALAYVGHFTDSFIGVINLDQRVPGLYGSLIATVGRPTPPRASK